jgi:hypothetical protein
VELPSSRSSSGYADRNCSRARRTSPSPAGWVANQQLSDMVLAFATSDFSVSSDLYIASRVFRSMSSREYPHVASTAPQGIEISFPPSTLLATSIPKVEYALR